MAFSILAPGLLSAESWKLALPGWEYAFPRDHHSHPDFKTEWWYFTGNLSTSDGHDFGYQLTFFRNGIIEPDHDLIPLSRFVTRDIKFAHFAVSDLGSPRYVFFQKISRGAYGEAGFDQDSRLAWIDDWSVRLDDQGIFYLKARSDSTAIDLRLSPAKLPVIHGDKGVSQKAAGEGRASHYYSITRLQTSGSIEIGGRTFSVAGLSWFDHEWATNELAANQVGWDWFSLQFEDGSELMLFQLRDKDGAQDENSAGTFITADGKSVALRKGDFTLQPLQTWTSPVSQGRYPVSWKIEIPKLALTVEVTPSLNDQELNLDPIKYWEGSIRVKGSIAGSPARGRGYLEMTGYAGAVVGLQKK